MANDPVIGPTQPAGGITALTGDVTAAGSGSVAATLADAAVATAKIADHAITPAKINNAAVDFTFPQNVFCPDGTVSAGVLVRTGGLELGCIKTTDLGYIVGTTPIFSGAVNFTITGDQSIVLPALTASERVYAINLYVHNATASTGILTVNGVTIAQGHARLFQWDGNDPGNWHIVD